MLTASNLQYGFLAELFEGAQMSSNVLSGITTLYFSLHSASPGDGGNQTTSEVSYTGYARKGVTIGTSEFTANLVNGDVVNDNAIQWNQCTGGTATARWVGIGTASSGVGTLLAYFPVVASGDNWMYCVTDEVTDEIDIYSAHLGTNPTIAQLDELAILPIYNDTVTQGLSGSTVYYVATSIAVGGTWPGPVNCELTTNADGSGGPVSITNTLGAGEARVFHCIRITPISISTGTYPTVNASGFRAYMT